MNPWQNGQPDDGPGQTPTASQPQTAIADTPAVEPNVAGNGAAISVVEPASAPSATVAAGNGASQPTPEPPAQKRTLIDRIAGSWFWRARGLLVIAVAIALALNAQRILIVDKNVVYSIRWYAVAIAVLLFGLLGTYKNKASMVMPDLKESLAWTWPLRRRAAREVAPTSAVVSLPVVQSTLPVRTRSAAAPTAPVEAPAPHIATTLPVRTKHPVAPQVPAPQPPSTNGATRGAPAISGQRAPGRIIATWSKLKTQYPWLAGSWPRYVIAFVAFGLNLYFAGLIRADYFSLAGGLGWVFSLLLLLGAFVGARRNGARPVDKENEDVEDTTDFRLPLWAEVAVVAGIVLLAFFLRFYAVDDLTRSMHGDEGETGMDALAIYEGDRVSPFMTGWFSHGNFSFWAIALTMHIFGTGLLGLRMFSVICGTVMIIPTYLLVRMWIGVRAAIIASVLLAVMDVSLYFGRTGLNNITTPLFLVTGFYFLFRGLRDKRLVDFILSGYSFMLTMYFYFGGRLTPYIVAAVIGYLFILMPIVRLPGAYFAIRRLAPNLRKGIAFRRAAVHQVRSVLDYFPHILVFVMACICFASPWYVYYADHKAELEARPNEKLVFNPINESRMGAQYGATHTPLYLGLKMPTPDDIYPILPLTFDQTPMSIKLTDDGFWPRVLWNQTTLTLSMFTYRRDESSFYTITNEPVTKPIEAALLVLGIAWAAWRWRDSRMAALSMWFWATVFAGGVLTIDAPYMPRMVGLVPVMAIAIALPLNKLAAELIGAASGYNIVAALSRIRWPRLASQAVTALAAVAILVYLGNENYQDYFNRYTVSSPLPHSDVTGQAYFVQQMNQAAIAQGRPTPKYYDLGMHYIYWGHGDNRFVNHGTVGLDMINPANELPVFDNQDRDVVFMVWTLNKQYLSILQQYYPNGEQGDFIYGPASAPPGSQNGTYVFTYYRVTKEQLDATRTVHASYKPTSGQAIDREETGLGINQSAPPGLSYPAQVSWAGGLIAPAFGRYKFTLDSPQGGTFSIDGTQVLTSTAASPHSETEILLARGPHDVSLKGTMSDASTQIQLQWSAGGSAYSAVPRQYLWNGPGRGLLGQVRPYNGAQLSTDPNPPAQPNQQPVIQTRIDGFLGFRHTPDALGGGVLVSTWTGTLDIKQPGRYAFDVYSNGDSVVFIDGQLVVNNIQGQGNPHQAQGQIDLTEGSHRYELRYEWSTGTGYLEAYWTPPGGQHELIGPNVLHTDAGIVDSTQATEPPPVQLEPPKPPVKIDPDQVISGAGLKDPRGIAVDGKGNMYVGDVDYHRIVVFSPDGKVLRTWGKAPAAGQENSPQPGEFGEIKDVAVKPDGTTYVLEFPPGRVQVFNSNGDLQKVYEAQTLNLYGANGIALGSDGSVYIGDTGRNRVLKLSADGLPVKDLTGDNPQNPGSRKFDQPVDAVPAPGQGDVLVYAIDLVDRIAEIGPDNSVRREWPIQVGRAEGGSRLAISPDGSTVYMSDPDHSRVAVLDLTGGQITYFGQDGGDPGQFRMPSGVAVGPDGRVYVLDRVNGNVQVFTVKKK